MNSAANPKSQSLSKKVVKFLILATIVFTSFTLVNAQLRQLSLADLLIGLRSQKVPLPDRNKLLTEAVKQRGVTFSTTPEIEKELSTTGADDTLLGAIREKSAAVKAPVVEAPKVVAPPPPDYKFYQTRADGFFSKGDLPSAAADYAKSIEMNADNPSAYVGRGKVNMGLKSFDLAVTDFDKALGLEPNDANAYYNRGLAYEKLNETKKAAADYQKAVDLDPSNEVGKASLKRMQDEIAKTMPAPQPVKPAVVAPEFLNLGNLSPMEATKMVTPVYTTIAQKSQVEGRVVVEVELDVQGNVTSAKAVSGHQMLRSSAEDAAAKSKFKPAMFDGKPIRARGTVTYNFSLKLAR
jgi:TonB family protein